MDQHLGSDDRESAAKRSRRHRLRRKGGACGAHRSVYGVAPDRKNLSAGTGSVGVSGRDNAAAGCLSVARMAHAILRSPV